MIIREITPADLVFAVDSVTREGWISETRDVFEAFYVHDPHGCFVGEHDGHPIGMIVATAYERSGFLGELIVDPDHRGHGCGAQLLKHAIAYLRGRGCGSFYLDGDTPAVPLYKRLGFRVVCRSLRFLGEVEQFHSPRVRAMKTDDLAAVARIDRDEFGEDRSFFLTGKHRDNPEFCHMLFDDGRLTGYIFAQPGNDIVSVGPWWVADGEKHGLDLLRSVAASAGDMRLRIGVLETNNRATALVRELTGMTETECSWRMVLGEGINLGESPRLWAVGAPATG